MLFERQKLLIEILEALGGQAGAIDFQKLLFLYTREFEEPSTYDFVPYKRGCFSFTSYADKRKLIEQGLLTDDDTIWKLTEEGRGVAQHLRSARPGLEQFVRKYGTLRGSRLVVDVYRRYPYFAINSEIVDQVLQSPEDHQRIELARPAANGPGLLTIGYEGKSLEAYLNQLLKAGVTVLCDVRRNALSRKYGFSKRTLNNACQNVAIQYRHLPELGIESDRRRDLKCQADYDRLFAAYERDTLCKQVTVVTRIQDWITRDGERIALTCYELDPGQCHRSFVAKAVAVALRNEQQPEHL